MSNLASNLSGQVNKTSGGISPKQPQQQNVIGGNPQQTNGSSSGNINNQTNKIQDFINKNNENFKKISDIAEKYFNEQEQKFDRDKTIEKFPNLDNFYNQITVKPKTQTDLKLSSNKLVDIINFQNFGNLSLESMKDIDRDSDPICKFANQIFEIKRAKKEATKQVTNTNPAQTSLIQNMEKSIQTIAQKDPEYSTTPSMTFARSLYTGDTILRTLNALEGYLASDSVKTAGYTYTPKSIINNHIEIVKLAILDNNTNDLSEEQKKKREETFKILYDVLNLQNIDSQYIVAYITHINSIPAFTEYCKNQNPSFDFSSILTTNQGVVSGISKLTNQPQALAGQAPAGQAPAGQQQTQNSALQNNQQQNAAGNSQTTSNTTINVPNDFVPKLKDAIKKDIESKNQGQYNEFKKALSQATGLRERIFNVNNDNDFYNQRDINRIFLKKAKNIIKLREQQNLWNSSEFFNTQNYLNKIQ